MRPLLAFLLSWLFAMPGFARTEPDFLAVAETLFPPSRGWPRIADAPALPRPELARLKNALQQAYRDAAPLQAPFEGPECSFIERAFDPGEAATFRRADLDRDGLPDIVYAGPALCAEGSATVIWLGSARGPVLHPAGIQPLLLLRVSPDDLRRTVSVAPGCCGTPSDNYHLGDLGNFHREGRLPLLRDGELPAVKYGQARPFATKRPVELRATPQRRNAYDAGLSELLGHAAFGNIVRTYLKGASGRAVGESKDRHGRWVFVVFDAASDRLASHDPYDGVRAGWVATEALEFGPAKAPKQP